MWIQLLLITGVVLIGALLMRRTGADSHLAIRRMLMALFVIAAILAILFPQWLSWVANLVGVGRGTDLLLYALVIAFLAVLYTQHRRNLATQRQLTLLARKIALLDAEAQASAHARSVEGDAAARGEAPQPDDAGAAG